MTDNPSSNDNARSRVKGGWGRAVGAILGIMAGIVLALAAALYVARLPVAAFLAERYLGGIGIPAEIAFTELSFEKIAVRVRLGPAGAPDFEADAVEANISFPSTFSIPRLVSARILRPRLKVKYDGEALSFGVLGPLMGGGGNSGAGSPLPDITLKDATLLADTPYGAIQFAVNAGVANGKLQRFEAALQPAILRKDSFSAAIAGGTVTATPVGDLINVAVSLNADSIESAGGAAAMVQASGDLRGLQWTAENGVTNFRLQGVVLTLNAASANVAQGSTAQTAIGLRFGDARGTMEDGRITAVAPLNGDVTVAGIDAGGIALQSASATIAMSVANIDAANGSFALSGPVRVQATGKDLAIGQTVADTIALELGSESSVAAFSNAAWSVAGPLHVVIDGTGLKETLQGGIASGTIHGVFDGPSRLASEGEAATLTGSVSASANLPEPVARGFSRAVPVLGGDAEFVPILTAALRSVSAEIRNLGITHSQDETSIALSAPALVTGTGDAKLTLTPREGSPALRFRDGETTGAFALDISGARLPGVHLALASYRTAKDEWQASGDFDAGLDFGVLRGAKFSGAGNIRAEGPRIAFAATRCADIHLDTFLANDAPFISQAGGRFCGEPNRDLYVASQAGWRFAGRWEGAAAILEILQSGLAGSDGSVDLSGNSTGVTSGTFQLTRGSLADRLAAPRFRETAVSGSGTMTATDITATLALAVRNRPFASVAIKQSIADGTGSAGIETTNLTFTQGQLQPADISPLLAALGTRATGGASFPGQLAWKDGTITSGGHLTATDFGFQSPAGAVRQGNASITFDSLIPVVSAQRQIFTAERIDSLVPLEKAAARFSFTQDAVRIEDASASMAGGGISLDAMTYVFAPDATTMGTVKIQNVDLNPLLNAAGLSSRVTTDAHVDGTIPFSVGPAGLRFANGRVFANRAGRLSIKRDALVASAGVGAGGAAPPNAVQDFAYQALENLAFDQLDGTVNSQPMGRLGVLFHMIGRNDPPQLAEARVPIADLIRGTAFDKPIPLPKGTPVDLRLDTSINLDELLAAYRAPPSP
jgi:Dicarboxylate transport